MTGNDESQLQLYHDTLSFIQNLMDSHPMHSSVLLMDLNSNIFISWVRGRYQNGGFVPSHLLTYTFFV